MATLAAALALALAGGRAWAQDNPPGPTAPASRASPSPPVAPAQRILVSGMPAGGDAAAAQAIVQAGYRQAMAAAGHPATLSPAQWQAAADAITAALRRAGFKDARAYPAEQVMAFTVQDVPAGAAGAVAQQPSPPPPAQTAPDRAATAVPALATTPPLPANVLPPVRERTQASTQTVAVSAFRVRGVGAHPDAGITPASMQALADEQLHKLGAAGQPARLDFAQLQQVADTLTETYRKAGFIFGTAFLPAQTIGPDQVVDIQVLEGTLGRVIVKGNKRYRARAIAASVEPLKGRVLRKGEVDSALLYARELPGVSVSSTFQPGEKTGQTDLLMVANEAKRPYTITTGANNYGTDLTGRYRAQLGVTWNSPLGIGDSFAANVDYAMDPRNNVYGSLVYRAPTLVVPGLSGVIGATRSELQLNSSQLAALNVKGPSSSQYAGADWKFVNTDTMQMQATLHYIREKSRLTSLGIPLSDESFDVAELAWAMNRTDQRLHGIDLLQVSLRKSIKDRSREPDLVSPNHARSFTSLRFSYTRLQFLTKSQRAYFKLAGQWTNAALAPLEQFVIGGPDSVRAYPIADGLTDRGYYASLEYHVDAPGFGNRISPFYARPWRELLELEAFVDYARGMPAGADRAGNSVLTFKGVGAGFIFRLPRFHRFEFHLDGAVPVGGPQASDKKGYHIYARFGFTF
ncbi:MAG: ShlB/FhaC/HecB family hemolysin secretion/activation protein [Xanthomonadaceae bacterium]|nr:ShlB/FhaC/HecB family hemolysin secretion/activation protein [Xanthomonadaceae bacterium]MDE1962910.1 ShlB/FhaC/HecB family hemolysin secretion/activation protein [Xanthomonadaceae bacterium]